MKTNILILLTIISMGLFAQNNVEVVAVGFYNLENLFDTIQDPDINDEDFLPTGSYKYNTAVYNHKLNVLSDVISQVGTEITPDGAAIMGVCEIENKSVLVDLVNHKNIKSRNYQIVHYDSPDERVIDVGMIYNPKYFTVLDSKNLYVQLPDRDGSTNYTRDVLWVKGTLLGEIVHVFVNHWPSRSGGEAKSSPLRELAAAVAKKKIDEIMAENKDAKIIVMGDLNDDPVNNSVKKVLGAKGDIDKVGKGDLYNPWLSMYKNGIGTLAYRDAWNLFDQIIISAGIADEETKGFRFYKAKIFNKPFLYSQDGRFKGYPKRTYSYGKFVGGYSDHLPTYIYLVRGK
jgi:hypothetical protein